MGEPLLLLTVLVLLILVVGGGVFVAVGMLKATGVHGWRARLRLAPSLWREWCIRFRYWDSMPARGWYEILSKRLARRP